MFLVLACVSMAASAQSSVIISEFLAHNTSGLVDEDGDYSDWIELYNGGTTAVNLGGWYLTDDAANLTKWAFPGTNIAAPRSSRITGRAGRGSTTSTSRASAGAGTEVSSRGRRTS